MTELCEVVITAPDPDWLLSLTRQLVAEGLCASVHNFSPVRSVYRWRGEVQERSEGRASLHTRMPLVDAIVQRVKASHPYEVPGISVRPIVGGNPDYLDWIAEETGLSAGRRSHPMRRDPAGLLKHLAELIRENQRALEGIYLQGDKASHEVIGQRGKIAGLMDARRAVNEWLKENSEEGTGGQAEGTA